MVGKGSSSKFAQLVIDLLISPWSAMCTASSGDGTLLNALIEPDTQNLNAAGTKITQLGRTNEVGHHPLFV